MPDGIPPQAAALEALNAVRRAFDRAPLTEMPIDFRPEGWQFAMHPVRAALRDCGVIAVYADRVDVLNPDVMTVLRAWYPEEATDGLLGVELVGATDVLMPPALREWVQAYELAGATDVLMPPKIRDLADEIVKLREKVLRALEHTATDTDSPLEATPSPQPTMPRPFDAPEPTPPAAPADDQRGMVADAQAFTAPTEEQFTDPLGRAL